MFTKDKQVYAFGGCGALSDPRQPGSLRAGDPAGMQQEAKPVGLERREASAGGYLLHAEGPVLRRAVRGAGAVVQHLGPSPLEGVAESGEYPTVLVVPFPRSEGLPHRSFAERIEPTVANGAETTCHRL